MHVLMISALGEKVAAFFEILARNFYCMSIRKMHSKNYQNRTINRVTALTRFQMAPEKKMAVFSRYFLPSALSVSE